MGSNYRVGEVDIDAVCSLLEELNRNPKVRIVSELACRSIHDESDGEPIKYGADGSYAVWLGNRKGRFDGEITISSHLYPRCISGRGHFHEIIDGDVPADYIYIEAKELRTDKTEIPIIARLKLAEDKGGPFYYAGLVNQGVLSPTNAGLETVYDSLERLLGNNTNSARKGYRIHPKITKIAA